MAVSRELSSKVRLPVAPSALRCSFRTNLVSVMVSTSTSSCGRGAADCRAAMAQAMQLARANFCKGQPVQLVPGHVARNVYIVPGCQTIFTEELPTWKIMAEAVDQHSFKKLALKKFPKLGKRESSEGAFWNKYQVVNCPLTESIA